MKIEMPWNTNVIQITLKVELLSESARLNEIIKYKENSSAYALEHDETLAKIEILSSIEGRSFLVSRTELLKALKARKDLGPTSGKARQPDQYKKIFRRTIEHYISRFI